MAEKDADEFKPPKPLPLLPLKLPLPKLYDLLLSKLKCLQDITDLYLSNMNPLIEEHILPDDDLSANHIKTLNKVRKYYDEERRPVTWDKVFATVNRKYTEITSANAVRRYEDFTRLVTKCKEKYRKAMELFVSESVYSERQLKEKHQNEMENSLHLFRKSASTTDSKWEKYLDTFIVDFYNKCLEANKSRLKVTEDLIAQYRRAMTVRSQRPMSDRELKEIHDVERRKAITQFSSDTVVEWLPRPAPDPQFLSHKLDTEYQTIKAANSNKRDQVYWSLVEKWTTEYDKKMKASMKDCILRKNDFNENHEKNTSAIKTSFDNESPTDGPCYEKWSHTLQTKVSLKRQQLDEQNSRKLKETIRALIDQHSSQFNRNLRGNLKEQTPDDTYREEAIRTEKLKEIERFRKKAPLYVEDLGDLEEGTQTLVLKIDQVADTVRAEIDSRKEEQRMTEICRSTLEEAFQQISKEMDMEFGPDTPHASQIFIKEFAAKLKIHMKKWYRARTQSCQSHWLDEIDKHVDRKEAEFVRKKMKQTMEVPMTDDHRELLCKLSSELVEKMELDDTFIAALISSDVISRAWAKDLGNRLRSQSDRTLEFLERLEKRPDSAYEGFMRALKHSGQNYLALQLL